MGREKSGEDGGGAEQTSTLDHPAHKRSKILIGPDASASSVALRATAPGEITTVVLPATSYATPGWNHYYRCLNSTSSYLDGIQPQDAQLQGSDVNCYHSADSLVWQMTPE
jgi:hypothetical protein